MATISNMFAHWNEEYEMPCPITSKADVTKVSSGGILSGCGILLVNIRKIQRKILSKLLYRHQVFFPFPSSSPPTIVHHHLPVISPCPPCPPHHALPLHFPALSSTPSPPPSIIIHLDTLPHLQNYGHAHPPDAINSKRSQGMLFISAENINMCSKLKADRLRVSTGSWTLQIQVCFNAFRNNLANMVKHNLDPKATHSVSNLRVLLVLQMCKLSEGHLSPTDV